MPNYFFFIAMLSVLVVSLHLIRLKPAHRKRLLQAVVAWCLYDHLRWFVFSEGSTRVLAVQYGVLLSCSMLALFVANYASNHYTTPHR